MIGSRPKPISLGPAAEPPFGVEGIVSKQVESRYRSGRCDGQEPGI
jgi:hypothetical protein